MKRTLSLNISLSISSVILASSLLFLISCGGSSSDSRISHVEARNRVISTVGNDNAFASVMLALLRGYSLQQIVEAATDGSLQPSGSIAFGDAVIAPNNQPTGTLVNARLSRENIQIQLDAVLIEVNQSYVDELGFDWNLNSADFPLILSEVGYSPEQIVTGILEQSISENTTTGNIFLSDSDSISELIAALERQDVLTISRTPSSQTQPSTEIDLLVAPTIIEFEHIERVTTCPQLIQPLLITNNGQSDLLITIPNQQFLNVSSDRFILGGNQQQLIDVSFNCGTNVPFLGEIPVIGQLFNNNQPSDNRQELLVVVTPTIIPAAE